MKPLTLNLYLPDGIPDNYVVISTHNWTGECVRCSRLGINKLIVRYNSSKVGVYFLFGYDDNQNPLIYVGESEDVVNRIKQHLKDNDKSWFEQVIVFTSSANSGNFLTKAHIKSLEFKLIQQIRESIEYQLNNGNNGTDSSLPEHMQPDIDTFFDYITLIMPILGFQRLFPFVSKSNIRKNDNNIVFYKNANGMLIENKKFRILKGSVMAENEVNSCSNSIKLSRKRLIDTGVVNYNTLTFNKDFDFNSPSTAGAIVYGGNVNGWEVWKNKTGETLNKITERKVIGKNPPKFKT